MAPGDENLSTFVPHRSKSTSDIQVDPAVVRQVRYEELQKFREQIKESEDKWQDVSISDSCLIPTAFFFLVGGRSINQSRHKE